MIFHALKKYLEGHAVMQVLTWMNFIAAIDARVVKRIQNRLPALRQLIERRLNQPGSCGHGYKYGEASAPEKVA
jgi:hypothetical protein